MSVSQAQSCIDSAEFSEWRAYHSVNPFTYDKTEALLAVVASILANVNRKKGTPAFKPDDFMVKTGKVKPETAKDIEIKLRAMFNGNN